MFKKTIAVAGLLVAVGGCVLASVPASAQVPGKDDHTIRKSLSNSRNLAFRHYHRTRNANWNGEEQINRLRLPLNVTNNVNPTVNATEVPAPTTTVLVVPTA